MLPTFLTILEVISNSKQINDFVQFSNFSLLDSSWIDLNIDSILLPSKDGRTEAMPQASF